MRLNTEQMEKFICERIPTECTTRIELANGSWANLFSIWDDYLGWELRIVTYEPERVDIWQIYEHLRRQETTCTGSQKEFDGDMAESKVHDLERENSAMGVELNHLRQTTLEIDSQMRTDSAISLISALPDLAAIAKSLARIADVVDPPPPDKVDTAYVAKKLGVGLARVSQMASQGEIPPSCIVAGTGKGKLWKFHRARIDEWIESR